MSTKEEVLKKIEKLLEEYEYWFEVFRKETDPKKREEAKQKYKPAISEIIRLQEEHNVRAVPQRSSGERARMYIDHKMKKLELSQEQVLEMNLQREFSEEKKLSEKDIRKKIDEQGDKYIKSVLKEMREHDLDTSKIEEVLRELKPKSLFSKLERVLRRTTLSTILPFYFVELYSGEVYIKDFQSKESLAVQSLKENNLKKAEEIFKEAIAIYDRAARLSKFSSGDAYFKMEKEKIISCWEATKQKILEERYHLLRQAKIKVIIRGRVKSNPGILQTDLYNMINGYDRNEISEAAYYMNREGTLRREKKGNTYKLFID
jgi:hypothetical protein